MLPFLSLGMLMAVTLIDLTSTNADGPVYKAVDDQVVLTPGSKTAQISSITWKHNSDIAMELFNGKTDSYRQFKVRGKLNVSTGALTITGLTRGDSGNYIAEINNQVTSQTQLLVIAPVFKPNITKVYNPENTECTLTCHSNITSDGPVTYLWLLDDNQWKDGDKITIKKKEMPEFSSRSIKCQLSNPISSKSSDPVENLFPDVNSSQTALIVCVTLFLLVLVVSCIALCVKFNPKFRQYVNRLIPFNNNQNHDVTQTLQNTAETTEGPEEEALMLHNQEQNSPVDQQHNSTVISVEVNHVQTSSENHVESDPPGASTQEPTSDPGDTKDVLTSAEPQHDHGESEVHPAPTSAASPQEDVSDAGASTDGLGNQEAAAAAQPETSRETEKSETDKKDLPEADQDSVPKDKAQG